MKTLRKSESQTASNNCSVRNSCTTNHYTLRLTPAKICQRRYKNNFQKKYQQLGESLTQQICIKNFAGDRDVVGGKHSVTTGLICGANDYVGNYKCTES